jgi:hypothetical protein
MLLQWCSCCSGAAAAAAANPDSDSGDRLLGSESGSLHDELLSSYQASIGAQELWDAVNGTIDYGVQ